MIFLFMCGNPLEGAVTSSISLGALSEFELEVFLFVSLFLVVLYFVKRDSTKGYAFHFENKDVLNQPVAIKDVESLPFTVFNLTKAYLGLFSFFIFLIGVFTAQYLS